MDGTACRVLFIGSKSLGLKVLRAMVHIAPESIAGVLTIDDRNDPRGVLPDIYACCSEFAKPIHIVRDRQEAERVIRAVKPEMCLVSGWYWLFGTEVLEAVPRGYVGIHNSLLPAYRGSAPLVWQMINGETTVGFSIFSLGQGMDDGPIWAQEKVPVGPNDGIAAVLDRIESRVLEVMNSFYPMLLEGTAQARPQDHTQATFCTRRTAEDGNIPWDASARDVHNFVRAQSDPYPGAFTYLGKKMMRVWRAREFDRPYFGPVGKIARITSDGVYVICGDQRALILEDVEIEGRRDDAQFLIEPLGLRLLPVPG